MQVKKQSILYACSFYFQSEIRQTMISTKKWFTIIEIIVIVLLISVWLLTVIKTLQSSNIYLQKSREKVIAINLAREWLEQMINIRDTNRQRWAWDKERTRLKTDPFLDMWAVWPENDPRFWLWNYIIRDKIISWQQYFFAINAWSDFNINNGITPSAFSLCESWSIRKACPGQRPTSNEWFFFRRIQWLWIFQKDSTENWWTYINCTNGSSPSVCGDDSAKEYRFCSIVEYVGTSEWKVELCSVLTNFKK